MTMRTLLNVAALAVSGWLVMEAQVYAEFQPATKVGGKPYATLMGATVLDADQFLDPATNVPDHDNGYATVILPFLFEYQGYRYSRLAISVNGFVMLLRAGENPPLVGGDVPGRLFINTEPFNVIAPFWGDHFYRTTQAGYVPSRISYRVTGAAPNRAFVVEWRDLNINNKALPSSVASFQVWLYESSRPGNFQGDIEFAYGLTGSGGPVQVQGAAIGIKGGFNDYLNGLVFTGDVSQARTSTVLNSTWQPSGGSDTVIRFNAIPRLFLEGWGDGDVDFSQVGKHTGMGQDRFVTVNDVMMILRSVATDRRLDSLKGRQAYHGDVNHNGRFYYSTRNRANTADSSYHRRAITTRSLYYWQDLPSDNSLPYIGGDPVLFFEATEYDAAIIMLYMAARVPYLPWLLDLTVLPPYGRGAAAAGLATTIQLREPYRVAPGIYRLPIALDGAWDGPLGIRADLNGQIVAAEVAPRFVDRLELAYKGGRIALAGVVACDPGEPLVYVTVRMEEPFVQTSTIRFNDVELPEIRQPLTVPADTELKLQLMPNPATDRLRVSFVATEMGRYRLLLYDVNGNLVHVLADGEYQPGIHQVEWTGVNIAGEQVGTGTYLCRVDGPTGTFWRPFIWLR
ncbi:MAG: hypothetical protein NZ949_01825 [Candidatus Kapabacteria bacterium]|nr:hypothetical protein [Candidatus Kapabacteria bacterium]MDW7997304.1 FlgD immunoglobulin-like domain containing protein [Bacteroidota bacterium]